MKCEICEKNEATRVWEPTFSFTSNYSYRPKTARLSPSELPICNTCTNIILGIPDDVVKGTLTELVKTYVKQEKT